MAEALRAELHPGRVRGAGGVAQNGSMPPFYPPSGNLAAKLSQLFDHLQLRGRAGQLGERFGLSDVAFAILQGFFRLLLGGQRGSFVDVLRAQGSVRQHGDVIRLHFERTAADEEALLFAAGHLHPHFTRLQQREQRRVPGRDAQLAHGSGSEHHLRRAREDLALGADDVDLDGVRSCVGHA